MSEQLLDLTDAVGFDIPWTAVNCAEWRSFLNTDTGKRLLGQLLTRRPSAVERSEPIKRAIQSAVVEGYEDAVRQLRTLTDSTKSVTKQ